MSLDPRILERFESDFKQSKQRQRDAKARVDALKVDIDAWQAVIDDEKGIRDAINQTLVALGVAPLV